MKSELKIFSGTTILVEPPPVADDLEVTGAGGSLKQRDLPRVTAYSSPGQSRGIPSRGIESQYIVYEK
jgi:hypothetical protein